MNHCCLELTSHCDTRYVWVFFINVWQSYVTVAVANLWCFILSVKEVLLESNTLFLMEFLSLFQRTCIFSTLCRLIRILTWQLLSSHLKKRNNICNMIHCLITHTYEYYLWIYDNHTSPWPGWIYGWMRYYWNLKH